MGLNDFTDERLKTIYIEGMSTINRIMVKDPDYKMPSRAEGKGPFDHRSYIQSKTDDDYFKKLVEVVFFAHAVSVGVERRLPTIKEYLGDYRKTKTFKKEDVDRMISDKKMFRSRDKVDACIENAKRFEELLGQAPGSWTFADYICSFEPFDYDVGMDKLIKDLQYRFVLVGPAVSRHFLLNFEFAVIKPDVNIMKTFYRIGLTEHEKDFYGTLEAAEKMANSAGVPVGWVDNFVNLGMIKKAHVCGTTPVCDQCDISPHCMKKGL